MTTTHSTDTLATLARGAGRLSYRRGRTIHLSVHDVLTAHPELSGYEPDIRKGWYAERAEDDAVMAFVRGE